LIFFYILVKISNLRLTNPCLVFHTEHWFGLTTAERFPLADVRNLPPPHSLPPTNQSVTVKVLQIFKLLHAYFPSQSLCNFTSEILAFPRLLVTNCLLVRTLRSIQGTPFHSVLNVDWVCLGWSVFTQSGKWTFAQLAKFCLLWNFPYQFTQSSTGREFVLSRECLYVPVSRVSIQMPNRI